MATMTFHGLGDHNPGWKCSECDFMFSLVWRRSAIHDVWYYCPHCGVEVDEFIDDDREDE